MLRITLFIILLTPLTGFGQPVYRTVDADGNVTFTDAPPADTGERERIEIPPINTTPPPAVPERVVPTSPEANAIEFSVAITSPADESTIAMGPGNFSLSAAVKAELLEEYTLQLFMNGETWGEAQTGSRWNLINVPRGEHDFTVNLLDTDGKAVATSTSVRVYVLRPSINRPNRARPAPR